VIGTWVRRAITVPAYFVLWLVVFATAPISLPCAALVDLVLRNRFATLRAIAMAVVFLTCEMIGLVLAAVIWLCSRGDRFQRWNFALQQWWASALFRCGRWIYRLRLEVDAADNLDRGPYIIFIRHTSVADTLLPSAIFSQPHGIVLRYVLKGALRWDPCLDIVGHRLPNAFVERGTGDIAGGVATVARLMANLGAGDGILIYPEGTRFTREKQARLLEKLAQRDQRLHEKAAALRHVMPPRLGGPLALLEQNESADVIFCAHAGLESANQPRDLLDGALVGATVRVHCWRAPFDTIPKDRAGRIEWLFEHWTRLDCWVDAQLENR
jgi:1-acyl-sn-glycerol-3-phosphate acyltransferase